MQYSKGPIVTNKVNICYVKGIAGKLMYTVDTTNCLTNYCPTDDAKRLSQTSSPRINCVMKILLYKQKH